MAVGGVETNLLVLGAEMSRRGHDVTVVSQGGVLETELRARGLSHVRASVDLRSPVGLLKASALLTSLIRNKRVDIVHAMSAAGNLASALVPRQLTKGTAFVSSPMGLQNSDRETRLVTHLRNRLMTLRADRILLISDEIARAIRAAGVPEQKLRELPVVGIALDQFGSPRDQDAPVRVRAELGIPAGAPLITTIGALHPRKSHDLFVRAAALVAADLPDAHFLIVGEGPERQKLADLIDDLGLHGRAVLAGRRSDVPAVLAASDVYVKPGVVEGFIGITVLEAQASGTPVIAFDTRDVRAAIEHGVTGAIVPNRDVTALASAIRHLLADRRLAQRLAAIARERVAERFSIVAVAAGLELEYRALLGPHH